MSVLGGLGEGQESWGGGCMAKSVRLFSTITGSKMSTTGGAWTTGASVSLVDRETQCAREIGLGL